jgi:hypothetical protein
MTVEEDWTRIGDEQLGQPTKLIPYTGLNEFFGVNMSEREMEVMKDKNGNIRCNKMFEWMLSNVDGKTFWYLLASRMQ